jgi:hypothetical protein
MNCFSLGSVAAPFQMTISCAKVGTGVLIILIGVWALVVGGKRTQIEGKQVFKRAQTLIAEFTYFPKFK